MSDPLISSANWTKGYEVSVHRSPQFTQRWTFSGEVGNKAQSVFYFLLFEFADFEFEFGLVKPSVFCILCVMYVRLLSCSV